MNVCVHEDLGGGVVVVGAQHTEALFGSDNHQGTHASLLDGQRDGSLG